MSELIDLIQTESPGIVAETLDFWLHECQLEDAPDAQEVALWRDMLTRRGGKFLRIADTCQAWLEQEQGHAAEK